MTVTGGLLCSGGLIVIGFTDHIALAYLGYGLAGRLCVCVCVCYVCICMLLVALIKYRALCLILFKIICTSVMHNMKR